MRNPFFLFVSTAVVAVLLCCCCQKERFVEELEEVDESSADVVRTICFSVDAFEMEEGESATKSTYDVNGNFYFSETDTVGIFPTKGAQVFFDIPEEYVGKQHIIFDGGGWALKDSYSYWSYSPLVGEFYLKKTHIPVEYIDLVQNGNESLNHISPVDFLYTDLCTVQDGVLSFRYHRLNCILRPRVTLPAGTYSKIVVQAENDVFVSKGYYDLTADKPSVIGTEFTDHLTLNLENSSFTEETAFVGNIMTAPVDISNMPVKVIIYIDDLPAYYYTYERSSALEANTPYGLRCSDLKVYVEKQDRGLSFSTDKVTCTLGNIPEKPVLAGNYTVVTYTSSDETVATVDADGNVTPVATGTVTVTAAAGEDDLYLEGSASYSLKVIENSSSTYTKMSSITVGGTYLIIDADDLRLFKGAMDGSFVDVYPESTVIIDDKGTLVGYEFTVENSGDNYYLRYNDGKYLVCNYTTNNGSSGLYYVDSKSDVTYPFALTTGQNGAFFFATTQMNSTSDTNQVLYFKSEENVFKIGGSGRTIGVHLYMKGGKLNRGLSFDPQSITCTLGDIPEKPALSGTYSSVTYSSSDETVATVDSDGNVTPLAAGIVTITASAGEDDQYNSGSASYTLKVKFSPTSKKYVRVTSADRIDVEDEYVIVYENGSVRKAFKPILNSGKNAFSTRSDNAVDVTVIDDEIEADKVDDCRIMLANQYENTKKFSLMVPEADGTTDYYLLLYGREYADSGTMTVFFASPTATGYRSTFSLSSTGMLTLAGNSGYNFQYSSSGYFTAGSGSSGNLYLFVRADGPAKQKQILGFASQTVSWPLGDNYAIDQSYEYPQLVTGAQTTVTYSCEPESVARIEDGRIKIVGTGTATVTAKAAKNDKYYAAAASYTLRILYPPSEDWEDLGSFNLENDALSDYLNEASVSYSDIDDAENTIMDYYASSSSYPYISRKDCPAPVTISLHNPASGSTVITVYEDQALTLPVWSQNATEGATSVEVYNLIPGRPYYYTVCEDSTVWEKGSFNTTGRRRMIKVSDTKAKGHANNCRDLGGLEVTDKGTKKTIKYGYIFRSTNLDKTTNAEKDILTGFLKIGMDIDLRDGSSSNAGISEAGNENCYRAFTSPYEVEYINPGFRGGYVLDDLISDSKVMSVVTTVFNMAKSGKSCLLHCYSGADRTGYFAMLIEGLLGVSEKDCTIDYELTSFSDAAGKRYRNGQPQNYVFREGIAFLRSQGEEGDTFQDKIEKYLVETVGISQADIDEFKSIVLF